MHPRSTMPPTPLPVTSCWPQPLHFQSTLSTVPSGLRSPCSAHFSFCPGEAAGAVVVTAVTAAAAAGCAAVSAACLCFCCCCGCLAAATGCLATTVAELTVVSTAGCFCCCCCGCGDCLADAAAAALGAGTFDSMAARFFPRCSLTASPGDASLMRTSGSTGAGSSVAGSAGLGWVEGFLDLAPCRLHNLGPFC